MIMNLLPIEQNLRITSLFAKALKHSKTMTQIYSGYVTGKIFLGTILTIYTIVECSYDTLNTWLLLVITQSFIQLCCYMIFLTMLKQIGFVIRIAEELHQVIYVNDQFTPLTLEEFIVASDLDPTVEIAQSEEGRRVNTLATQIKSELTNRNSVLKYIGQFAFLLNQGLIIWALVIEVTWGNKIFDSSANGCHGSILIFLFVFLILSVFQYLDFYLLLVLLLICLPFILMFLLYTKIKQFKQETKNQQYFEEFIKVNTINFQPESIQGDQECRICMSAYNINDQVTVLPCNPLHHFHTLFKIVLYVVRILLIKILKCEIQQMIKNIVSALKQGDIFAQPVTLLLKKEKGHQTLCGSFFTICLAAIVIVLGYAQLVDMIQRNNPTSFTNTVFNPKPYEINLLPKNFTMQFDFDDENFVGYVDPSVYTFNAYMFRKHTVYDSHGGSQVVFENETLPTTICSSKSYQQQELYNYFMAFDPPTFYCIDWNKIQQVPLLGTYDSEDYRYIQIDFYLCNDQNRGNVTCMEREKLLKYTNTQFFSMQISSATVDLKNIYNPNTVVGQDLFTAISNKLFKEVDLYLKPIVTQTDYGYITEDLEVVQSLAYSRWEETILLSSNDLIFRLLVRLDTTEVTNYRSYPKLQTIFGNIGGIIQVLYALFMVLYEPVRILSMKLEIINQLFNFERPSDQISRGEKESVCESKGGESVKKKNLNNSKSVGASNGGDLEISQMNKPSTALHRFQSVKQMSKSLKFYLQKTSRALHVQNADYIKLICSCCFKKCRTIDKHIVVLSDQIRYSSSRVDRSLDILFIIKKLNEIDRLKMLLLDQDQINLFDYLPKPTISTQPFDDKKEGDSKFFTILKNEKSHYQNALDAQRSFRLIKANSDILINQKLLSQITPEIQDLFNHQLITGEDHNKPESDCQFGREMEEYQSSPVQIQSPSILSPSGQDQSQFHLR